MIQFVDREAYCVDMKEVTRTMVITHFCQKGHNEDMLLLYDDGTYVGFIVWDNVLGNMEKDVLSWLVKDVIVAGKNLLEQALEYFSSHNDQRWLMILNQSGQPEAFAYDRQPDDIGVEEGMKMSLLAMEKYPEEIDIRLMYPKITTIYLHGCNEWTIRLYRIFIKQKLNVMLQNEMKWDRCFGIKEKEIEVPEYEVCHIWAEPDKTKPGVPSMTVGIINILVRVCGYEFVKKLQKIVGGGILKIIDFPINLGIKSIEEYYRIHKRVEALSFQGDDELDWQMVEKVSGIPKEEIATFVAENNRIYEKEIRQKLYGNITASIFGRGKYVVWLIGPCIVGQRDMRLEESFAFQIYKSVNTISDDYEVRSVLVMIEDYIKLRETFQSIPLNSKDIILFLQCGRSLEKFEEVYGVNLNLSGVFSRRDEEKEWFWNTSMHTTPYGNEAITKEIYDKILEPALSEQRDDNYEIWPGKLLTESAEKEINNWIGQIKEESKFENNLRIGAVVMNCNPFTLGHRYLLELALKEVDGLYVFVVEEDRSFFSFEDRYRMVCDGTSDLKNIKVVPSGKFVLSAKTFAEYFQKEYLQEEIIDATQDIEIFSRYIVPGLGIKVRFVGEEHTDYVTWQYNRQMEKSLLKYGIEFVEIPRKKFDGEIISASIVRKLLKDNSWESMKYYLPNSTMRILEKKYRKTYAEAGQKGVFSTI